MSRIVGRGLNGDPLHEGKLDLPELLEQPTTADMSHALQFIESRRWQEAVTYRQTAPHEYTVRTWASRPLSNAEFDGFVVSIRRFGYADFYYKIRHIYWVVGEFKYWTMGWPIEETTIVNRALASGPEPWKSKT